MVWPTCGARRSSACRASGMPLKFCRPLSTPPMRVPRPPASTKPVISSAVMCIRILVKGLVSAADVAHFDPACARRRGIVRRALATQFGIAVGSAFPDVADGRGDVLVARLLFTQQGTQVVAAAGEQAKVKLAFGRQARTRAVVAEGLRHAADDADFAQCGVVL